VSKNALARFSSQVWAKLLSLILVALVARYESAAGLGRYALVLTVVGFAGAVTDLGLNLFLTREVAKQVSGKRQQELLGTLLPLKLILATLGLLGLVVVAALAPFPQNLRPLLPLASLLLLPEAANGAMRAFVNGRQRMEVSSLIDMVVRMIALALSLLALTVGLGIPGVLICSLGAAAAGSIFYGVVLWRWRMPPDWKLSLRNWRAYLSESYPFAITSIASMAYARMDLILLGLWQGESAAGWYSAAYRLWETLALLPTSILDAMFPEMSRLATSPDGLRQLRTQFVSATRLMLIGGILLAIAGVLSAAAFIPLIYGSKADYTPSILPFRLLVCAAPAMFLYLLSGHTLYALGKQRRVTVVMVAVGLVNVALNLVVIPRWSIVGAASVALLTEWLLVALLYPQARHSLST
jgi:O-antigen/teichoic acid export membrane protein